MVAAKEYNKLDSRKQELMMLRTTIEFLETQLDEQKTVLATSDGGGGGTNAASGIDLNTIPSTPVQHWRVTKQGASICSSHGKTHWWCEQHVNPAGR